MECLSQEPVLFEDVLCQMHDMVQPEMEGVFTLQDLKRQKCLAGILFNILFNLNKFIAFETRDPFVVRQVCLRLLWLSPHSQNTSPVQTVCVIAQPCERVVCGGDLGLMMTRSKVLAVRGFSTTASSGMIDICKSNVYRNVRTRRSLTGIALLALNMCD